MNLPIDIRTVVLRTPRLILRPWKREDLADFYAYASVDGVGQMAGWLPHKNLEESRQILELFIQGGHTFALEKDGKVIGSLGIDDYNEDHFPELSNQRGRELGYALSKDYWGRGLMPEAVQAVIDYLFRETDLDFLLVGHFDWNRQSARVIEKCGFRFIKACPYPTRYGTVENSLMSIRYRPHVMADWEGAGDTALVQELYRRMDEGKRLTQSKAARVEFLTNLRYVERYGRPGDRVLDVGAGTGIYSLALSRRGYQVTAVELADANLRSFRRHLTEEDHVELCRGNALDLSRWPDHTFDLVLLMGPLYHLHGEAEQRRCLKEAMRVCKPGGKLFAAFLSNDMVFLTMFCQHQDYIRSGAYHHDTFRLTDFPFVFHTTEEAEALLRSCGLTVLHRVASDGVSELLQEKINALDEEDYAQYLRYHAATCEKPGHLDLSNHLLYVCQV